MESRLPPHSIEAEQAFLGCLMLGPWTQMQAACRAFPLTPLVEDPGRVDDSGIFYDLRHATIFQVMRILAGRKIQLDVVTVCSELKTRGMLESVGGIAYVTGLADSTPSHAAVTHYADILRDAWAARKMLQAARGIAQDCMDWGGSSDTKTILERAEREVIAVRKETSGVGEIRTRAEILTDLVGKIQEAQLGHSHICGVSTGLAPLDRVLGGWKPGKLYVIAAPEKTGKSAFARQVADHAASIIDEEGKHTCPVAYFSFEMTAEEIELRSLSAESGVDSMKMMMHSGLSPSDMRRIVVALGAIKKRPLRIVDKKMSVDQLIGMVRRQKAEIGCGLVVVDYLQLVRGTTGKKFGTRENEVSDVSRELKGLALDEGIPVIALAQMNRGYQHGDRDPRPSDLRESGAISQDADCVMFLWPPSDVDQDAENDPVIDLNLGVKLHRGGPTGIARVQFQKPVFTMRELPRRTTPIEDCQ